MSKLSTNSKFLGIGSLILLNIVIVGNLQPLPACAIYGFSLPFYYLLATVCFFIPCITMVTTLATKIPQTGGAYIWVEKAFGKQMGFFSICTIWFSNLLWYPSIFSLIAINFAYVFMPDLAQNKNFIIAFALGLFWLITILNCRGIHLSSKFGSICSIIGIILPTILIVAGGVYWWLSGQPRAINLQSTPLIPNLKDFSNIGFLIAVIISLFGIEITAVHAGNVRDPKKTFPKSLIISSIIIVMLLTLTATAISIIVPHEKLSVISGLLDALQLFFQAAHWNIIIKPILFLIFLGNLGSACSWMLGSTRGMFVGCLHHNMNPALLKTNSEEAPIGILIMEAIVFTISIGIMIIFPKVNNSFWLLLDLASQITLLYYAILFLAAINLLYKLKINKLLIPLLALGAATSLIGLAIGFIPTPDIPATDIAKFHLILIIGLLIAILLPWLFLWTRGKSFAID